MKKILITIVATVLVCACIAGGTIAWLMDTTDPVKNTFTIGSIDIELAESVDTDKNNKQEFKMIPGEDIKKDPVVTVKAGSEACWVFIKLEKVNNPDTYLEYSIDTSEWTQLTGTTDVWYKEMGAVDADKPLNVLKDKIVTVDSSLTKAQADTLIAAIKNDAGNAPALTFTAYAIQRAGFNDVTKAWEELNK